MPPAASPAAKVIACSSAIPTSKNLFGKCLANVESPVPSAMAAVIATTLSSFLAISVNTFEKNLCIAVCRADVFGFSGFDIKGTCAVKFWPDFPLPADSLFPS